jgi:hypothetical protein
MSEYDWILDQYEQYGEDRINSLMDNGYVPYYVAGRGWRWMINPNKDENECYGTQSLAS